MRTVEIPIPYEYSVVAMRARSRTPERWRIRDTARHAVRAVSTKETVEVPHLRDGRGGPAPVVFDGRLWFRASSTIRDLDDLAAACVSRYDGVFGDRRRVVPFSLISQMSELVAVPGRTKGAFHSNASELRGVVPIDQEAGLARALLDVDDILLVDGAIHTSRTDLAVGIRWTPYGIQHETERVDIHDMRAIPRGHFELMLPRDDAQAWIDAIGLDVDASRGRSFAGDGGDYAPLRNELASMRADVPSRYPAFSTSLRLSAIAMLRSVMPYGTALQVAGSGSMGVARIDDRALEAAFDLRETLRGLGTDMRVRPDTRADVETVMDRMDDVREAVSRFHERPDRNGGRDPSHEADAVHRLRSIWNRIERHRTWPGEERQAEDHEAIATVAP